MAQTPRIDTELAERVLRRAIEMQDNAARSAERQMTVSDLQRVASEVGVDESHVSAALAEEFSATVHNELTVWEKLFAPGQVNAGFTVDIAAAEASDRVDHWLDHHLGLTRTEATCDVVTWARQGSINTVVIGASDQHMRQLRTFRRRVLALGDSRSAVELQADTSSMPVSVYVKVGAVVLVGLVLGIIQAGWFGVLLTGVVAAFVARRSARRFVAKTEDEMELALAAAMDRSHSPATCGRAEALNDLRQVLGSIDISDLSDAALHILRQ